MTCVYPCPSDVIITVDRDDSPSAAARIVNRCACKPIVIITVDRDVRNTGGCLFFSEVLFVPVTFLICAHITASESPWALRQACE